MTISLAMQCQLGGNVAFSISSTPKGDRFELNCPEEVYFCHFSSLEIGPSCAVCKGSLIMADSVSVQTASLLVWQPHSVCSLEKSWGLAMVFILEFSRFLFIVTTLDKLLLAF